MSETSSNTPMSSDIADPSDSWDLPLNKEEQKMVQKLPVLKEGIPLMRDVLYHLSLPFTQGNSETLTMKVIDFTYFSKDHSSDIEIGQFCGDYMARRRAPLLIQTFAKDALTFARKVSLFDDGWRDFSSVEFACLILMGVVLDWADDSLSFCLSMCDSDYISFLLSEVRFVNEKVSTTQNLSLYEGTQFFKRILMILHNCTRRADPVCIAYLKKADALSALYHVRCTRSAELKWMALTIICNIAGKDDTPFVEADALDLEWCIKMLKACTMTNDGDPPKTELGNSYEKYEIIAGLESITNRPENRKLAVTCGALPVLIELLLDKRDQVQLHTCRTLGNLSQVEGVRRDVRETDAGNRLEVLCRSSQGEVRKAAKETLRIITKS